MPERLHIPDVIEPDERLPQDLVALRRFAFYMDEAFEVPGTKIRVGYGAIIGLVPGVGDVLGGLLSLSIIAGALRHRVPAWVVARMVANIAVDIIFGSIPVAGDLFDFLFEENVRNMRLLEKHRERTRPPRSARQIAFILALIAAFTLGLAILLITAVVALVVWLIGQRSWF